MREGTGRHISHFPAREEVKADGAGAGTAAEMLTGEVFTETSALPDWATQLVPLTQIHLGLQMPQDPKGKGCG